MSVDLCVLLVSFFLFFVCDLHCNLPDGRETFRHKYTRGLVIGVQSYGGLNNIRMACRCSTTVLYDVINIRRMARCQQGRSF